MRIGPAKLVRVRIEDDAVLTRDGCRLLTDAKKRIEDVTVE